MDKDRYIKTVLKKLKCSNKRKNEIKKELQSDIEMSLVNGETWKEIEARMGTSVTIASEFNDNFSDAEIKAAKKMKHLKIATVILAFVVFIGIGIYWMLPKTSVIDSDSKFDEQLVISQAEEIILLLNDNDYDTIKSQYSNAKMSPVFDGSNITDVKNKIASDWGQFKAFGTPYTVEVVQSGKDYAVVQVSVSYDNISVTYTITFDEEMKLAGLYMK